VAAFFGHAGTPEVALAAGVAKTVLQIVAPANQRLRIIGFGLFFDGTSGTDAPVLTRVLRQTTAGTFVSTAQIPTKADDSLAEAMLTRFQYDATAEPTPGDVMKRLNVHPQSGYEIMYPPGQEIYVGGSDRLGIECTAGAVVNVVAVFYFEE